MQQVRANLTCIYSVLFSINNSAFEKIILFLWLSIFLSALTIKDNRGFDLKKSKLFLMNNQYKPSTVSHHSPFL